MKKLFFDYNFIIFLFLLIFSPFLILIMNFIFYPNFNFLFNKNLSGVVENINKPPLNLKNIKSHSIQKYYEQLFIKKLPLRSLTIRLNNQIYYSFFNKSYSNNNQIVIGNDNQLLELPYIKNYCQIDVPKITKEYVIAWADKIKKLNDFFISKGKKFIYLIVPSKVEYLPSSIPARFRCKPHGISPQVRLLETLLTERGIPYVNGPQLMIESTKNYKISMFPKGGTHWNYLAGAITANFILETVNQSNSAIFNPLSFNYKLTSNPEGTDVDLFSLLNLLNTNVNYLVPKLTFKRSLPIKSELKLAVIGDSFATQFINAFLKSEVFSEIFYDSYFTFNLTYKKNSWPTLNKINKESSHALDDIMSSDIVILEENTANTMSNYSMTLYNLMNKLAFNSL
ncbi:MAG: hypothetical protein WAL30_06570 [Candidatus Aquirickettsiella sp.]